jgi:hypothetical protein
MHTVKIAIAALAALILSAAPAAAQGAFAGTWVIRPAAATAPWVPQGTTPPADSYQRRLAGGRVTFARDRISGPEPLACRRPHYETRDYGADMLFQGNLNPADAQATALGFSTRPIKTLETGCAGGIDFHLIDDNTMAFALNNRIYTLDRVRPSPRR